MDKNTVWAIALSTVVIGAFMVLQATVFAPQRQNGAAAAEQPAAISADALPEIRKARRPCLSLRPMPKKPFPSRRLRS